MDDHSLRGSPKYETRLSRGRTHGANNIILNDFKVRSTPIKVFLSKGIDKIRGPLKSQMRTTYNGYSKYFKNDSKRRLDFNQTASKMRYRKGKTKLMNMTFQSPEMAVRSSLEESRQEIHKPEIKNSSFTIKKNPIESITRCSFDYKSLKRRYYADRKETSSSRASHFGIDSRSSGANLRKYCKRQRNLEIRRENLNTSGDSKKAECLDYFKKTISQIFKFNRLARKKKMSNIKIKGLGIRVRDTNEGNPHKRRCKANSTSLRRHNLDSSILFNNKKVQNMMTRENDRLPQSGEKENIQNLINCSYNNYLSDNIKADACKNHKKTIFQRVKKLTG
ncbi:unnamed protein product [Moneuplotes crassus]|uniref:Uncharacterized protein n=1 Tax=Euplotes crassus TaxID=5936 RepID=A0AAD1ULD9_EUPCR|nr:unnamed protein product [Moneuplotes crassus]